ncbi:MAG: hypothetical protein N0C84_12875 [Candidatus Thiodiazotropha taylori]|uniref:Uncharacterized protein n=1 Tax=Candidatus Thiodiazotropha taylori TaxID=2792791 RepID=A0A9E4N551_9GAMM|nr:hypothetical protein [Candidatus Thiodiazotropha taylori]RLW68723.1 MAG: hypothetical protein B6D71_12890 [gamma proteobacterium symbiont of Stewartia floridana]MCG7968814.1 hypothetical protein [Candidatus Thiodiazotropha taylori]MCG8040163.1 hypothetical protein [Candidatus Thiodiazotropha taylori]MCW4257350.1 hypothetical protein [Candidatus Thiodiazotropha taylori]
MNIDNYDVYFSGALIKDSDPEKVKRKVGAMFKLEGERLERLFSGKPIPIKRGIDMDRAIKYRVAFRDAGGLVDIVPAGEPPPKPKPPAAERPEQGLPPQQAKPVQPTETLTLADGPMEPPPEPPHREIEAPDFSLSKDGFDLSDCTPEVTPQVIPDISNLDFSKEESKLDQAKEPEPLHIDTSALDFDTSEHDLEEQRPAPTPNIDTGTLSLSPAKQGTLEDCQEEVEPAAIPNLDHLKIVEGAEQKPTGEKAKFKLSDD